MSEGKKIKQIRECCGLTQQELAKELGVSKQYLSKVETDGTDLSKDRVIALCNKYSISADWLLLDIGDMQLMHDEDIDVSIEDCANDLENYFKHDLNLELYSLYITEANNFITYKYPNATVKDIVEAAKELYSADINHDLSFYEMKEILIEFKNNGERYKSFKDRIITAYYRVASKQEF